MPTPTLESFALACQSLYGPGLQPAYYAQRAFEFLHQLIPSDLIACGVLNPHTQRLDIGFDHQHPAIPTAMEAFGALMGNYSLFNWDPHVNHGLPFRRSQFFSNRQFRDLDVYQEVYHPLGISNHCAVYVPTTPDEILFFGIERGHGVDFSDDELGLLEMVQIQLANAHALSLAIAQNRETPVSASTLTQAGLTPREAETLAWFCQGKTNSEVALFLGISNDTVKGHLSAIFNKTGANNRLASIVWAQRACRRLLAGAPEASGFVNVAARLH